jgi:LmbE family N-acetylglucosaminyl deacetylase
VKPHLIVRFEPHGEYHHPDHLAIQRDTTTAFFSSGVMGDEAPERLFYGALSRDVFRVLAEASRGRGMIDGRAPFGVWRRAGDAEESAARRSADVAGVWSGDGARGVPPRR